MKNQKLKQKIAKIAAILSGLALLTIGSSLALASGEAQWPNTTSPATVKLQSSNVVGESYGTRTSDGYYIMIFQNSSSGIYAQKIDSDGNKQWNAGNPQLVHATYDYPYEIVADNSGGAFILHQNISGIDNVYVSRINSSGTVLWTTGAFDINTATYTESWPRILHDGDNGVYVAWSSEGTNKELFVTRLNSSGNLCTVATCGSDWNSGGSGTYKPVMMPLADGASLNYRDPRLILSDSESIIIVYHAYPSSNDLFIVKLDGDGSNSWGVAGTYVEIDDTNPVAYHQAETDGSDGVYIGYYAQPNLKIAKINSAGTFTIGSAAGGVTKKTIDTVNWTFEQDLVSTADSSGNLYLGWSEKPNTTSENDAYVQKYNSSGTEQWTAGGVFLGILGDKVRDFYELTYLYNLPHTLVPDGSGGVIAGLTSWGNGIGSAVKAQKVSSSGSIEWGRHGTFVTEDLCADGDWNADIISDTSGGAILSWYQNDNWAAAYIAAQAVDDAPAYTKPAKDTIEIHLALPSVPDDFGIGISNGDDTGALSDLNFSGSPTGSCTYKAESYAFTNGEPTSSTIPFDPEEQSWTTALEYFGGGSMANENDKYSTDISLGFTATIYGKNVDTVRITSNGFVYLNSSGDLDGTDVAAGDGYSMTNYANLPAGVDGTATTDILIAGAWGQINTTKTTDDRIRYYSDPANEIFIIDFFLMEHPTDTDNISSQIKIMGNGSTPSTPGAQNIAQEIGCPGASEYTFEISNTPDSVTFDSLAFDLNDATDSYDAVLNNDETIDDENLLTVTDTRSGGSADCPAATKGFTVTVEVTTTLISSESHTIADSNFRAITSNELATQPPTGYEAWSDGEEIWYDDAEDTTGNLWDIDAPFLYDDSARDDAVDYDKFNYEDAYKKTCGGGDSEGSCTGATFSNTLDAARTLLSTTTSHNTAFSTGVAVYGEIPAAQEPGTYTGTITYTLAAQ